MKTMTRVMAGFFSTLTTLGAATVCWAAPPGPPVTPLGGTELSIATAVAVAAYGFWKVRK